MGKLWGGRFSAGEMDPEVLRFTSSLDVDIVLAQYDIKGSESHVKMLSKCGFIGREEEKILIKALGKVKAEIVSGKFDPEDAEDIHSAIQERIEKICPDEAKKLHTARSRNEQVVNDVRLYCLDRSRNIEKLIKDLQKNILDLASRDKDIIIPGYTHLNRAQPVLFAHLLLAYIEMLDRDAGRISDARKRLDMSVMGSGAIGGSALSLDREFVAKDLGFKEISRNSIDSVSDRDFMAELLSAFSILAVHLSRISEDLILYSTSEFGLISMGEEFTTGSSLMPQKKNPDVLELIRGKASSVTGDLSSMLTLLKAQPHSYNRDLQEDKRFLFRSVETVSDCLSIMAPLFLTIKVNVNAAEKALKDESMYATDIAEYLVSKGMPFSEAHRVTGKVVGYCAENDIGISGLSEKELRSFSDMLSPEIFSLLSSHASVSGKKTEGSTNPGMVERQISRWENILKDVQDA